MKLKPYQQAIMKTLQSKRRLAIVVEKGKSSYHCKATVNNAHTFGPRQCMHKAVEDGLCTRHYKQQNKEEK